MQQQSLSAHAREAAPDGQPPVVGFTPQLLRAPEVAQLLNIGVSTWWDGVKKGRFPAPIRFGRSTRWRRTDIEALFAPAE